MIFIGRKIGAVEIVTGICFVNLLIDYEKIHRKILTNLYSTMTFETSGYTKDTYSLQ